MNPQRPEVVIVSASGRGVWLASELSKKGMRTQFVDVSDRFGRWAPEDIEGPFGVFRDEHLLASQWARLSEEDYLEEQPQGVSVWPPEGPIDLRGWLTPFWNEVLPEMAHLKSHLEEFSRLSPEEQMTWSFENEGEPFQKVWLASLAYHWAAPVFDLNSKGLSSVQPSPLAAPFFLRRVTRKGRIKGLEWLKSAGVEVIAGADLLDLGFEGRKLTSIEVSSESVRAIVSEQFVLALSPWEIAHLWRGAEASSMWKPFPEPQWVWMRWRLSPPASAAALDLPAHVLVIDRVEQPWVYSNFIVLQKCTIENQLDAWMRVPSHHRFQKEFLDELAQELVKSLAKRMPEGKWEILENPQEYHYSSSEIGPSQFPVMSQEKFRDFKNPKWGQTHWLGPDTWKNYSWTGRFSRESEILNQLSHWKEAKIQAELKKGPKDDRTIHAP